MLFMGFQGFTFALLTGDLSFCYLFRSCSCFFDSLVVKLPLKLFEFLICAISLHKIDEVPDMIFLTFGSLGFSQIPFYSPVQLRMHFSGDAVVPMLQDRDEVREGESIEIFEGYFWMGKESKGEFKGIDLDSYVEILESSFFDFVELLDRVNLGAGF